MIQVENMSQKNQTVHRVAVLSAGNGGITFAAHLLDHGVDWVSLYNRSPERLEPIRANGNRIFSRGVIGGQDGIEMPLALVTGDPVEAIEGVDFIVMAGTQPAIDHLGTRWRLISNLTRSSSSDLELWDRPGKCAPASSLAAVKNCLLLASSISCPMPQNSMTVSRGVYGCEV